MANGALRTRRWPRPGTPQHPDDGAEYQALGARICQNRENDQAQGQRHKHEHEEAGGNARRPDEGAQDEERDTSEQVRGRQDQPCPEAVLSAAGVANDRKVSPAKSRWMKEIHSLMSIALALARKPPTPWQ